MTPDEELARFLARQVSDGELRALAREGPHGHDVEAEIPGDAAPRTDRAAALVGAWRRRGLLDALHLSAARARCADPDELEAIARRLGCPLPPRTTRPATVRVTFDADVDPHDLVALLGVFHALRGVAPDARMTFAGAGRGSLWIDVEMDEPALLLRARDDGRLTTVGGYRVRSVTAGSPQRRLPPRPRDLSPAQLLAWLELALPVPVDAVLRGGFLDHMFSRPALAMESTAPPSGRDPDVCLITELATRDELLQCIQPEVAYDLFAATLDAAAARVSRWSEERRLRIKGADDEPTPWELAVQVPARAEVDHTAWEAAADQIDSTTLDRMRERCIDGLRLLIPRDGTPPIPRYWARRDGSYHERDGFLAPTRYDDLIVTSDLTDGPVQVLLGEPGAGKSTELRRLAEALWVRRPSDTCEIVDLRSVGSHDHVLKVLGEARWGPAEPAKPHHWLLIDAFDECLQRVPTLPEVLLNRLRRCEPNSLRLRVACRTGAWPTQLEAQLAEWARQPVTPLELLPLRRDDARGWAARGGVDAEALLAAVDRRGLAARRE
ncbi:MAG TPA: hypothetical protein PKA64_09260 [Myxococcota bacterium]|nr:hypothetical protein [Myxococcota bacterium]